MISLTSILGFFQSVIVLANPTLDLRFLFLQGQRLALRYPGGDWITPGSTLDIKLEGTTSIPEIGSEGLNSKEHYLLLTLDPDVILKDTKVQTVILHWYQPYLTFNNTDENHGKLLTPDNSTAFLAPYIAPQPPENSHHRYIFLLFLQSPSYVFPDCFSHIAPETLDARAGFDLREFMHAAALDPPVAVNFFYGRNQASDHNDPPPSSVTTTSFLSVTCTTSSTTRPTKTS